MRWTLPARRIVTFESDISQEDPTREKGIYLDARS
jgi:hypothetical protein